MRTYISAYESHETDEIPAYTGTIMRNRTTPISGITGQSCLAELLLSKGYEVHGLKRRSSSLNPELLGQRCLDVHNAGNKFFLHYADLTDSSWLAYLLTEYQPDEIYKGSGRALFSTQGGQAALP